MDFGMRPNITDLSNTYKDFLPNGKSLRPFVYQQIPADKLERTNQFSESTERKYGKYITAAAVIGAGILAAVLYRGGKFVNIKEFAKNQVNKLTLKITEAKNRIKPANMDFFDKIRLKIQSGYLKFSEWVTCIGNSNPFKDIAFDRLLTGIEKTTTQWHKKCFLLPPLKLKTLSDWTTKKFTQCGKTLAKSKYKAPQKEFNELEKLLRQGFGEIGESTANGGNLAKLSQVKQDFTTMLGGFSKRFDNTVSELNKNAENRFIKAVGLNPNNLTFSNIWKAKKQVAKRGLQDFIPLTTTKDIHQNLFKPLLKEKDAISNNILDVCNKATKQLDEVFFSKKLFNDTNLRGKYFNIKDLFEKFQSPKKFGLTRLDVKNNLLAEIQSMQDLVKGNNKADSSVVQGLQKLYEQVANSKKGQVEELVSLCKPLKKTNPELYEKIISQRNRFQKALSNAVGFETEKSYGKLLDFSLHSLATDFMTYFSVLGGLGAIILGGKKSKDEKVNALIKAGIPGLTALSVGFLCNVRQVASGFGGLMIALASGWIASRISNVASTAHFNKYIANKNMTTKKETI